MPHPERAVLVVHLEGWKVAHPVSDLTQPCLTSAKLMVLCNTTSSRGYHRCDFDGLVIYQKHK